MQVKTFFILMIAFLGMHQSSKNVFAVYRSDIPDAAAQGEKLAASFPFTKQFGFIISESFEICSGTLLAPDLVISCAHPHLFRTDQKQVFVAATQIDLRYKNNDIDLYATINALKKGTYSTYRVISFATFQESKTYVSINFNDVENLYKRSTEAIETELQKVSTIEDPSLPFERKIGILGTHYSLTGEDIAILKLDQPLDIQCLPIPFLKLDAHHLPPAGLNREAVIFGATTSVITNDGEQKIRLRETKKSKILEAKMTAVKQNVSCNPAQSLWFSKWIAPGAQDNKFIYNPIEQSPSDICGITQGGQSGGPLFLEIEEQWVLAGLVSQALKFDAVPCLEEAINVHKKRWQSASNQKEKRAFLEQSVCFGKLRQEYEEKLLPLYDVFQGFSEQVIERIEGLKNAP